MSFSGLQRGDVVDDRFELARPLGAGTFGEVWVAHDLKDNRRAIALKLLRPHLGNKPRIVQRFVQEIEILQRVEHPNIVKPISAQTEGSMMYLALELIEGVTLKQEMEQRARAEAPYSFAEVGERVRAIADALQAAHSASVVHRDLKPSNIMVLGEPKDLQLRVLDFGIAKLDSSASERTTAGRMLGTLMYMAPEQLRGQEVDARADVFALAVIAFELLTLKRVFARDTQARLRPVSEGSVPAQEPNRHPDVMRRISFEQRPVASHHRPEIPSAVDVVLAAGLEVQCDQRVASAALFSEGLLEALKAPAEATLDPKRERARAETAFAPSHEASIDLPPTSVSPSPLTPEGRVSELTPTPLSAGGEPPEQASLPEDPHLADNATARPKTTWILVLAAIVAALVAVFLFVRNQPPASTTVIETVGLIPDNGERTVTKAPEPVRPGARATPTEVRPPEPTNESDPNNEVDTVNEPPPPKRKAPPPPRVEPPTPSADPWAFDASDPQAIRSTAARLERVAAKLEPTQRVVVQRCAALAGISRSARELQACLTAYKKALAEQLP